MIERIGQNAGLVWEALHESDSFLTLKEIKKRSKIRTEKEVCLAIGWLAKEDKLRFDEEDKDVKFGLK